jgi:hypothetical protein
MSVSFLEFDGYFAPVWICDTCGAAIGKPAMRSSSQILTVIALAFRTVHKGMRYALYPPVPVAGLDQFMWELFHNAKFAWDKVAEQRARCREFGLNN